MIGPCRWGWHDWPKWTDTGTGSLFSHLTENPETKFTTGYFAQQERRCERCGKLQIRREVVTR